MCVHVGWSSRCQQPKCHASQAILFFVDISEHCGFSLPTQARGICCVKWTIKLLGKGTLHTKQKLAPHGKAVETGVAKTFSLDLMFSCFAFCNTFRIYQLWFLLFFTGFYSEAIRSGFDCSHLCLNFAFFRMHVDQLNPGGDSGCGGSGFPVEMAQEVVPQQASKRCRKRKAWQPLDLVHMPDHGSFTSPCRRARWMAAQRTSANAILVLTVPESGCFSVRKAKLMCLK